MRDLQIPGPVSSNIRWRRTVIKTAIILAVLLIWQGSIRRATTKEFGTSLYSPAPTPGSRIARLGDNLRVATFNMAGGVSPVDNRLDLSRTAKCLGSSFSNNFDMVGLQEVHGASLFDHRDQAAILGDILDMPYLFAPSERRWWHDDFGNGILCNLPVTRWQRLPISTSQSESNRSMLRVFCTWHDHPLAVIITHLDRHADHDIELGAVIASFYDTPTPVILMGDLNIDADPADPQLDKLRNDISVTDALGQAMGASLPKTNDWIFARGLRCVAGGLTDNDASDHKLAWAELAEPK